MTDITSLFLDKFNKIVQDSRVFLFITRDSELQKQACNDLDNVLGEAVAEQKLAIAQGNEDYSNVLLGCQCIARALSAEI